MQYYVLPEWVALPQAWALTLNQPDIMHHISRVMRLKPWKQIILQTYGYWNQPITRAVCTITEITKEACIVAVDQYDQFQALNTSWPLLVLSLLNTHQRLERAVQKCTEIGVHRIAIVTTQYSPQFSVNQKKKDRAESIAREALEQSHWIHMPYIERFNSLEELHAQYECSQISYADCATTSTVLSESIADCYCIWPEWGWWERDYEFFKKTAAQPFSLWTTILRAETAAVVTWWELQKSS